MSRVLFFGLLAAALGICAGEYLAKSFYVRQILGEITGRGTLEALVDGRGIYDREVARQWQKDLFVRGLERSSVPVAQAREERLRALGELVARAKLDHAAAGGSVDTEAIQRQMDLVRWQFTDDTRWRTARKSAGISPADLQEEIAASLRDDAWLEAKIAPMITPNESEMRPYFADHSAEFREPLRLRASHLFLAAPEGYPDEVIASKRALIEQLSRRVAAGESFDQLVARYSEDEGTMNRGGDLGYFAEERMLPEVFAAAEQLQPGQVSAPVRSRLGFHLIRLTEIRLPRVLSLDEARGEIAARLSDQKRPAAVDQVLRSL